jgi:hypothetical protein
VNTRSHCYCGFDWIGMGDGNHRLSGVRGDQALKLIPDPLLHLGE